MRRNTELRQVSRIEAEPGAREPGDAELIARISLGCEESFHVLFLRWAPRIGRLLAKASGSPETGEDLLQETFLRILRGAPGFEPRGSGSAWIYRIAANVAYSHWRRERARPRFSADGGSALDACRAPARSSPDSERLRSAFLADAAEALGRLRVNKRIVFVMKIDQGLTYEEIAAILRCPVGTVKSRFHHAVREMQVLLEKKWREGVLTEGMESDDP